MSLISKKKLGVRAGAFAVLIVVSVVFAAANRDMAARYVWEHWQVSSVALALLEHDAELAMKIGDYHYRSAIGTGVPDYDPERARTAYEKALSIEPGILWGHYQLARIHFVNGEFDDALQEAEAELEANPANLRVLYVQGLVYAYRGEPGDIARSEESFQRFTEWAPTEWAGYNDLAWVLMKEKKYEEARGVLEDAFLNAHDAETNPWLWNMAGISELNLGNFKEAEAAFERTLVLANGLDEAAWHLAYPGNDPALAPEGLTSFRNAVSTNLERARMGGD